MKDRQIKVKFLSEDLDEDSKMELINSIYSSLSEDHKVKISDRLSLDAYGIKRDREEVTTKGIPLVQKQRSLRSVVSKRSSKV